MYALYVIHGTKCKIVSEMLNLVRNVISVGRRQAFMSYLLKHYETYQVLVVKSLAIKFGLLSEELDFNCSALDYEHNGFFTCLGCQYLKSTISIIIIQHLGTVIVWICRACSAWELIKSSFWAKSCFDLCGCFTASLMAENDAESYLLHQSRYSTEAGPLTLYVY